MVVSNMLVDGTITLSDGSQSWSILPLYLNSRLFFSVFVWQSGKLWLNFGETTKNQVLTKIEFCFFSLKKTFIPQHTYTLPNRHVNVLNLS